MKYLISILVASLVAGGAALYYVKARKLEVQHAELAAAKTAAEERARQLETEKQRTEEQEKKLLALADELGTQLKVKAAHAESNSAAVASAVAEATAAIQATNKPGGLGKMISGMLSDPDMRNFIREQQRGTMDQLYSPLVRQLGLSPEHSAQFKELLLNNMMKAADKAGAIFGTGAEREQVMKDMAAEQKVFDEEVRAFLGDEGFQRYKEYSLTLQERAQLNAFRQLDPTGAASLNEQQTEQLLAIMAEEKKTAMAGAGAGANQDAMAMEAMGSEAGLSKLLEMQEGVNSRVYERASTLLDQTQLNSFARFQSNQIQQMRFGLSMARKMFEK